MLFLPGTSVVTCFVLPFWLLSEGRLSDRERMGDEASALVQRVCATTPTIGQEGISVFVGGIQEGGSSA